MKYEIGDMILYAFRQTDNNHVDFIAQIVNIDEYTIIVNDRFSDSKVVKNFGKITLEEIKEQFPEYFI